MSNKYILSIDQSTQATKGLLFDSQGSLIMRYDMPHEQIIDNQGFVEHNPNEIYENTIKVVKAVVERADINKDEILGLGISNQRETVVVWDKETGEPIYGYSLAMQRKGYCKQDREEGLWGIKRESTGLQLSPFSAAKYLGS